MESRDGLRRRRFLGATVAASALAGCSISDYVPGMGAASCEGETPDGTDVTISSESGDVEATRYGSGECGVVLTPQVNMDRESWEPQVGCWADRHLVLAIDPADEAPASVVGAVDHLQSEEDVGRVVLVGASIGGEASVVAAADRPDAVSGVVAISPGGGEDRAAELSGETLFAVAESDDDRFVETTAALHEGAEDPKELVTYDGSEHGQDLFESDHGDDLLDRIDGLVDRACG